MLQAASAATTPMVAIRAPRPPRADRSLVQLDRNVRTWPPPISAYDIFLEYRPVGGRDWTACETWDPIVINRD